MDSRAPLDAAALRRALPAGGMWTDVRVLGETGSTNAELAELARAGAAEGTVVTADRQNAGRGRLGRGWSSPYGAGLAVSMLLRPEVPANRYGWLPLLAGVALAGTVREVAGVPASLKWPNDLLVGAGLRKAAGILAEVAPGPSPAVVCGIGLNVSLTAGELPREDATSLALAGAACTDRTVLLADLLGRFADRYRAWTDADGDPRSGLADEYRGVCATLGRRVRAELPGGGVLDGSAEDVDADGRLVIVHDGRRTAVAAADVVHLRAGE